MSLSFYFVSPSKTQIPFLDRVQKQKKNRFDNTKRYKQYQTKPFHTNQINKIK